MVKGEPFKDTSWRCICGHTFCQNMFETNCTTGKTKTNILKALRTSNWNRAFAKWFCPICYQKYLDGTLPKGIR